MMRVVYWSAAFLLVMVSAPSVWAQPCPGTMSSALDETSAASAELYSVYPAAGDLEVGSILLEPVDQSALSATGRSIGALSVPEPTSVVLLLLATLSAVALRRRSRTRHS